ncbi:MAG: vitamin K epoxide reductase family protein, partial [Thermosynechococcaceae cyanobacterium]
FGTLAYGGMAVFALSPLVFNPQKQKELRKTLEDWTWLLLLIGSISMVTFSGYLMYLLFFKINAGICIYCIASATFTVLMLLLTLFGREWPDLGQVFFTGIVVAVVAVMGTLVLYQSVSGPKATANEMFPITTNSGPAEIALAEHLTAIDAKMYGAYWCPHCHDQKQLFGKEAFAKVNYIECDPKGPNPKPDLCKAAKVEGFPTWHVQKAVVSGAQSLAELGKLSAYKGPQNFKNVVEGPVAPPS